MLRRRDLAGAATQGRTQVAKPNFRPGCRRVPAIPDTPTRPYNPSRDLLDSTRDLIRRDFPGLDIHYLQRGFDALLLTKSESQNYGVAFMTFAKPSINATMRDTFAW
jgi:hypothetical protein